jgi:NADPH:quinone reductase-like Zn-dependent oxidoreductase
VRATSGRFHWGPQRHSVAGFGEEVNEKFGWWAAPRVDFAGLGRQWDVVADVVGTALYARSLPVLAPGGRLLQVLAPLGELLAAPWRSWTSGRRVIAGPVTERREDLEELASLAASGALRVVVDRSFPFAELAAAHRYVDEGHKVGNVVVLMEG